MSSLAGRSPVPGPALRPGAASAASQGGQQQLADEPHALEHARRIERAELHEAHVLRDPLSRAFALQYDVTGSWTDPIITRQARITPSKSTEATK